MLSFFDLILFIILAGLAIWIMQLKTRMHDLEFEIDSLPPEKESISPEEIKNLRTSLNELVYEIETYTEGQIKKINVQTEAIQVMVRRLEESERQKIEALMALNKKPSVEDEKRSARVVPIKPYHGSGVHKDRDRIIDLFHQGWTMEQIAEELRLTRSEVQLVVNLS